MRNKTRKISESRKDAPININAVNSSGKYPNNLLLTFGRGVFLYKISPFEIGYQLKAIITLHAFMGKLKPFLEKVKTYDEVINCYRITGDENIVMEVVLKNHNHLEVFIDKLISYGETKTQIVLSRVVKQKAIQPL